MLLVGADTCHGIVSGRAPAGRFFWYCCTGNHRYNSVHRYTAVGYIKDVVTRHSIHDVALYNENVREREYRPL